MIDRLNNLNILIGCSGSVGITAIPNLIMKLRITLNAKTTVCLTENACKFVTPLLFQAFSGNPCFVTIDDFFRQNTNHITLAKQLDVILIAPATANLIGKIASGVCDDALTMILRAADCPKVIYPSMNTQMWRDPITQDKVHYLRQHGFHVATPAHGNETATLEISECCLPEQQVIFNELCSRVSMSDYQRVKLV